MQGWNDFHRDRPGRLQRSWRRAESRQVGRGGRTGFDGVGVSGCYPRAVGSCVKGGTDRRCAKGGCFRRQHRSDGCHRQVQGRYLLKIEAPRGLLLASRWCRRVPDEVIRGRRAGPPPSPVHLRRRGRSLGQTLSRSMGCPVGRGARRRPASSWAIAQCRSVRNGRSGIFLSRQRRRTPRNLPVNAGPSVRRYAHAEQQHLRPESTARSTILPRLLRIWSMGRARSPSLPPSSRITTRGWCRASARGRRANRRRWSRR